jgi:hypothetical protein
VYACPADADLLTLYTLLAAQFSDLSAPVYRGVLSSHIDPLHPIRVRDPTGRESPANPLLARDMFEVEPEAVVVEQSGGSGPPVNNTMVIVLAVVGAALLIVIATVVSAVDARVH